MSARSFFSRDDLDRPPCFDIPGKDWKDSDVHEALIYLFSGVNLAKNVCLALRKTYNFPDPLHAADEVTSEYAATKFRNHVIPKFKPELADFETWHFQVFCGKYNFIADEFKRLTRRPESLLEPAELARHAEEEGMSREGSGVGADKLDKVRDCLEALTGEEQQILDLTYVNGMKSAEIGVQLGLTPATVRQKIHRGRGKLRKCLRAAGIFVVTILCNFIQ